jgi:hypothetical protein
MLLMVVSELFAPTKKKWNCTATAEFGQTLQRQACLGKRHRYDLRVWQAGKACLFANILDRQQAVFLDFHDTPSLQPVSSSHANLIPSPRRLHCSHTWGIDALARAVPAVPALHPQFRDSSIKIA